MLANIATKTVRDRWQGFAIGSIVIGVILWWGMIIYQDIDLSVYTSMPDVFLSMMNIPKDADVGSLAYGAVYGSYGALTLAGLALSVGSSSVAGEERHGTIGLLLGNPKSRTTVLFSKTAALVGLTALGTLIMWIAALIVPPATGVSIEGMHPNALMLHIFAIALFFGSMALAISAWTGRQPLATGVTVGAMIVSFIAAGLLPLIEGWEDLRRAVPWYYYDGSQPVFNGVDWGHLAVLGGGIAGFWLLAYVGVNHRDLRERETGVTIIDRLRAYPLTKKVIDRLAGSARVSGIWIKTLSDHQALIIITGYVMGILALMMGPLYGLMDEAVLQFAADLPETLVAMVGGADMGTAAGFYQAEIYSLMAPVAVMAVTIVVAAKGITGEEANRTMGLLLANPIPRRRIVLEKTVTMIFGATIVGFITFAGTAIGNAIGNLAVPYGHIAAISVLVTVLGLVFGALAMAIAAATGKGKLVTYGTSAVAFVAYMVFSFLPLSEGLAGWAKASPFYYFLGSDPLNNGMDWGHLAALVAMFAVLTVAAVVLFDRRDLRQSG